MYQGTALLMNFMKYFIFIFFPINFISAQSLNSPLLIAFPEAKPYASSELVNNGFYPELIIEVFNRLNYDIEIIFLPFKRILRMLKEGTLAGAGLVSYDKNREAYLIYPDQPLYIDNINLMGLKEGGKISPFEGIKSLKGVSVGVFRGSQIESELIKNDVDYEPVETIEMSLRMLLANRIDFVISPEVMSKYLLKNRFNRSENNLIEYYQRPLKYDRHFLTFSKKMPNVKAVSFNFDRTLLSLKADGTYKKIKDKYHLP